MNVLLLVLQYPPDVNSTGMLMQQVANGLRARGHRVDVVTSVPHYDGFRVAPQHRGKWGEAAREEPGRVLRLPAIATGNKASMADRLLSYAAWGALSALGGATRSERYDVVFAINGGFFTGLSGRLVASLKGAPLVFNVQDVYPDVPVESGQLKAGMAVRVLEGMARVMYDAADVVTTITPGMAAKLESKGVPRSKIEVIPNFVDVDFIRPVPKDNSWSRRMGLHDKFVVAHAGNVGFVYDLSSVLDAAKALAHRREIVFLIVGEGAAKAGLQERAKREGIENVRFLPYQPREELPLMRGSCDVQLAVYRRGSARNSMPSKVYEIMASGRPVLASAEPESDLAQLIADAQCGLCVPPEDPQALAAGIQRLQEGPALSATLGKSGRSRAVDEYSRDVVVERYLALFARLAARGNRS